MDFPQTYQTTIYDVATRASVTVFVVPSRSVKPGVLDFSGNSSDFSDPLELVSHDLDCELVKRIPFIDVKEFATLLRFPRDAESDAINFANYVANARIVPFESSPLGPDSLSSIAATAHKYGAVGLGAGIGWIAAEGHGAFILITVPLGILVCGLSVSLAKWLEENRKRIWERLIIHESPERPRGKVGRKPATVPTEDAEPAEPDAMSGRKPKRP